MDSLVGIRVLDFTRILAGPFATMILGDLGAEVIKIERPGVGDETRSWAPPTDASGTASYFLAVNRNKTSVSVDLNDVDLSEITDELRDLVARADVIVENFRPGVMTRLGLDYEAVRAINPDVVYCSISAFGSGAGAALPGYDLILQAVGGLMSLTGDPEGEPQKVGVALVDVITGLFADIGILAALRHRERTGEGQHVEVNLLSCLLAALANQSAAYTVAGVIPQRMGNAHPSISPYEVYPTAYGDLAIAVGNDRQFAQLCEVLGNPSLAADSRFVTNPQRVIHRAELKALLVELLVADSSESWAARLNAQGVPAGKVNDISEAFALAEGLGIGATVDIARDDGRVLRLPANPIGMSRTPPRVRMEPPGSR